MSLEEIKNYIKLVFPNKYDFSEIYNHGRFLGVYHILDDGLHCDVGFISNTEEHPLKVLHISIHSKFAKELYEDMCKIFHLTLLKRPHGVDFVNYTLEEKDIDYDD